MTNHYYATPKQWVVSVINHSLLNYAENGGCLPFIFAVLPDDIIENSLLTQYFYIFTLRFLKMVFDELVKNGHEDQYTVDLIKTVSPAYLDNPKDSTIQGIIMRSQFILFVRRFFNIKSSETTALDPISDGIISNNMRHSFPKLHNYLLDKTYILDQEEYIKFYGSFIYAKVSPTEIALSTYFNGKVPPSIIITSENDVIANAMKLILDMIDLSGGASETEVLIEEYENDYFPTTQSPKETNNGLSLTDYRSQSDPDNDDLNKSDNHIDNNEIDNNATMAFGEKQNENDEFEKTANEASERLKNLSLAKDINDQELISASESDQTRSMMSSDINNTLPILPHTFSGSNVSDETYPTMLEKLDYCVVTLDDLKALINEQNKTHAEMVPSIVQIDKMIKKADEIRSGHKKIISSCEGLIHSILKEIQLVHKTIGKTDNTEILNGIDNKISSLIEKETSTSQLFDLPKIDVRLEDIDSNLELGNTMTKNISQRLIDLTKIVEKNFAENKIRDNHKPTPEIVNSQAGISREYLAGQIDILISRLSSMTIQIPEFSVNLVTEKEKLNLINFGKHISENDGNTAILDKITEILRQMKDDSYLIFKMNPIKLYNIMHEPENLSFLTTCKTTRNSLVCINSCEQAAINHFQRKIKTSPVYKEMEVEELKSDNKTVQMKQLFEMQQTLLAEIQKVNTNVTSVGHTINSRGKQFFSDTTLNSSVTDTVTTPSTQAFNQGLDNSVLQKTSSKLTETLRPAELLNQPAKESFMSFMEMFGNEFPENQHIPTTSQQTNVQQFAASSSKASEFFDN